MTRDHEVGGLLLVVGARKATWCVDYKPHGTREDGSRHAKVRMTLGDAMTMPLPDARTAARAIKLEVAQGRNPHAEKRDARVQAIAERAIKPMTLAEALDAYEKDMLKRREPSEATRRQAVHYARKAIALMEAGGLAVDRLDVGVVRKLIRTMDGSASEVRHVYGGAVAILRLDGRGRPDRGQSVRRGARAASGRNRASLANTFHRSTSSRPCGPPSRRAGRCAGSGSVHAACRRSGATKPPGSSGRGRSSVGGGLGSPPTA